MLYADPTGIRNESRNWSFVRFHTILDGVPAAVLAVSIVLLPSPYAAPVLSDRDLCPRYPCCCTEYPGTGL